MTRDQIAVRLDCLDEIDALAQKERRTRSDMIRILIDDALGIRQAARTAKADEYVLWDNGAIWTVSYEEFVREFDRRSPTDQPEEGQDR